MTDFSIDPEKLCALPPEPVNGAYERLAERQSAAPVTSHASGLTTPITDLREACERLGLNQAQLADRLGVDAPRVSKWMNGTIPPYVDLAMRTLLALEVMK